MAIPVIEGSTSQINSSVGDTLTLTKPAGVVVGELLLLQASIDSTLASPGWTDITGWTRIISDAGGGASDAHTMVYYRIADGTEAGSEDVITSLDSSKYLSGYYQRVSGVDTTTPIHLVGVADQVGTSTTQIAAEITTTVAECLGFALLSSDGFDTAPATIAGTGWTIWGQQASGAAGVGTNHAIATKSLTTADATVDATFTMAASDGAVRLQFAVAPGAAGGTTTTQTGDIQLDFTVTGNQGIVP